MRITRPRPRPRWRGWPRSRTWRRFPGARADRIGSGQPGPGQLALGGDGNERAEEGIGVAVRGAEVRAGGESFGHFFGAVRPEVDWGVSVGIHPSIADLLHTVGGYLDQGYRRIKLKIRPGWDVEPVRAVREEFGDVPLQVDANTAYSLSDATQLAKLDRCGLLLIAQPMPEEQVLSHADLA